MREEIKGVFNCLIIEKNDVSNKLPTIQKLTNPKAVRTRVTARATPIMS